MSQGSHLSDTVWIVLEPDMCMYEVDATSRIELVQGRMPREKFKDYEEFADEIVDPTARA